MLDLGGGGGFTTLALQREGFDAVLLEPTPEGVKTAREKGARNVIQGTLQDIKFKPGIFDIIVLCDVLEHVENENSFLDRVHDLLENAGRLYLTVPAFQSLWSRPDVDAGHFRRYNLRQISKVLEAAHFKIEFSSYFFSWLFLPLFLLRKIPWLLDQHKSSKRTRPSEIYRLEHGSGNARIAKAIAGLLKPEIILLPRGFRCPIGTSCFVVAKKI